jgi:glycosyltransferase involved in cell wall biosynthesis
MDYLISIIVPLYKSELFIDRLYNSLSTQTYSNLEIIFVNDGSPDNSGAICDEFAKRDKRVKVLHQENKGAAAAVGNGTEISSGDFIMFLDADDWIEQNTCELSIKIAQEFDVDMVFWLNIKEYASKSVYYKSFFERSKLFDENEINFLRRRMIGLIGEELKYPMTTDAFNAGWGKLYRADAIKDNNVKWTDTMKVGSSDVLFNTQLMPFIKRAYYLDKHLHHYYKVNPNSLTRTYNGTLYGKFQNLFKEIAIVIDENYNDVLFKDALNNRIALSTINISLSLSTNGFSKIAYMGIKEMLNSKLYQEAYRKMNTAFLPIPYKLFFLACRLNMPSMVLVLALIMQKIRN